MKPEDIAKFLNTPIVTVEGALREPPSIDNIVTTEQAQEAYMTARDGSENERLAMVKWLSFCTNLEQARNALDSTNVRSELQRLAMVTYLSFCITPEQVRKSYNATLAGSEAERLVIQKLAEMPDEE